MDAIDRHRILSNASIKDSLKKLDILSSDAILFVVDNQRWLIEALTDGDLLRGFEHVIVDILNFRIKKTIIPADGLLMAEGIGKRLMPLSPEAPKRMLKIGDKPIIEYNGDRLLHVDFKRAQVDVNRVNFN